MPVTVKLAERVRVEGRRLLGRYRDRTSEDDVRQKWRDVAAAVHLGGLVDGDGGAPDLESAGVRAPPRQSRGGQG